RRYRRAARPCEPPPRTCPESEAGTGPLAQRRLRSVARTESRLEGTEMIRVEWDSAAPAHAKQPADLEGMRAAGCCRFVCGLLLDGVGRARVEVRVDRLIAARVDVVHTDRPDVGF